MTVRNLLFNVKQHAAALPQIDSAPILKRLRLAREFLGTQNPLDFFLSWRTPAERYHPIYSGSQVATQTGNGSGNRT